MSMNIDLQMVYENLDAYEIMCELKEMFQGKGFTIVG